MLFFLLQFSAHSSGFQLEKPVRMNIMASIRDPQSCERKFQGGLNINVWVVGNCSIGLTAQPVVVSTEVSPQTHADDPLGSEDAYNNLIRDLPRITDDSIARHDS